MRRIRPPLSGRRRVPRRARTGAAVRYVARARGAEPVAAARRRTRAGAGSALVALVCSRWPPPASARGCCSRRQGARARRGRQDARRAPRRSCRTAASRSTSCRSVRHGPRRARRRPAARAGRGGQEGSTVSINVSSGPGESTIPAVKGTAAEEAASRIEQAGFKTEQRQQYSGAVDTGRVIETSPRGHGGAEGSTVTLVVSRGQKSVSVPTWSAAIATMRVGAAQRRVQVDASQQEDDDADPGTVLSQDPTAGMDATRANGEDRRGQGAAAGRGARRHRPERGRGPRQPRGGRPAVRTRTDTVSAQDQDGVVLEPAAEGRQQRRRRRDRDAGHRAVRSDTHTDTNAGRLPREGRRAPRRPFVRARRLAGVGRIGRGGRRGRRSRGRARTARARRAWRGPTATASRCGRAAGCSAPTPPFPCCTAPSARTAPCRACSSCSTCPTSARACSPRRCAWTRSSSRTCWPRRACRRSAISPCASRAGGAPEAVRAALAPLGLPLFVKPARLGSSVGIAKVHAVDELDAALDAAFAHDGLVIAEAFSAGVEVECAVMGLTRPTRRCRARSCCSRAPSGTTTRPSTRTAASSCACRPGSRPRPSTRCGGSRSRRSCALAAPGWRAWTSSSRTVASWSTSSTRCPG